MLFFVSWRMICLGLCFLFDPAVCGLVIPLQLSVRGNKCLVGTKRAELHAIDLTKVATGRQANKRAGADTVPFFRLRLWATLSAR